MVKSDDPRAAYIEIATNRFAASGFHGVSLAALAKDAGVTKQALLHFFGTKARLYAAVLSDLSERLCADIEATEVPDPAAHLMAYFQTLRATSLSRPDDMRLVVRALLDSAATARTWPLKAYLDRLVALAHATDGGRGASQAEVLAWLAQMIGMIQYMAISTPAVSGIYGTDTAEAVNARFETRVADATRAFTQKR